MNTQDMQAFYAGMANQPSLYGGMAEAAWNVAEALTFSSHVDFVVRLLTLQHTAIQAVLLAQGSHDAPTVGYHLEKLCVYARAFVDDFEQ